MKKTLLKFFVVTFFVLTTNEILSNSCNSKYTKKNKRTKGCETESCGAKNVRQHRFAKSDQCPRTGYKTNQKSNRKTKTCCN